MVAATDADLDPYNPADPVFGGNGDFTLTAINGTVWTINAANGMVNTETDRNGNTLTFSSDGITSRSGRSKRILAAGRPKS